jgi:hypothetical protein
VQFAHLQLVMQIRCQEGQAKGGRMYYLGHASQ